MATDIGIKGVITKKAKLYDARREQAKDKIRDNIQTAINKLKAAEKELLSEVDIEFSGNPFVAFLASDDHTDEEVKSIISIDVPESFGPDEESFCSLLREIESFKNWSKKQALHSLDSIPQNLKCTNATHNTISVSWNSSDFDCFYDIELRSPSTKSVYHTIKPEYTLCGLEPATKIHVRVRVVSSRTGNRSMWSDPITIETKEQPFTWKKCPAYVYENRRYFVDENNIRIARNNSINNNPCTIIDNAPLLPNVVTSWSIKVLKSRNNNGYAIYIGIAPNDINQNDINYDKCGWYFNCYSSKLYSGPPHNYDSKEYGPRKGNGQYVHTGDSVGVVVDTIKGELSFILDGVNLGAAYCGIPLDKPLVPCVILEAQGDSVEFDT